MNLFFEFGPSLSIRLVVGRVGGGRGEEEGKRGRGKGKESLIRKH